MKVTAGDDHEPAQDQAQSDEEMDPAAQVTLSHHLQQQQLVIDSCFN